MIPNDIVQEIKQKADIVDVISEYVKLKKKGDGFVGSCPFHNEKTPSFTVSPAKDMYKCFGCGASGNSVSFIMAYKKLNYPDTIKLLADKYFISIPDSYQRRIIKKPVAPVKAELPTLVQWLGTRGISEETINHFGITFTKDWMPKAQKETDAICFNYFRGGELINIKYRAAQKDFKLSKDAELIFYNLDSIGSKDYVIITEGEIDCLTVSQCTNYTVPVISVPNGAAIGAQKLEYLDNCWDIFTNLKQVIIFVDNDHAGTLLRDELARRIGFDKCLKVVYPEDCKDANEILLKHSKEKVLECIKSAVEFPIEGVFTMGDLYDDVRNYYDKGYPVGYTTGIHGFDELLTFMEGQLTTVTAVPGCFTKNQKIHTSAGIRLISEIKTGDKVLSYNHKKQLNEYRTVTKTHIHKTHHDKLYRLKLKDGTIIEVTENHEFFNGARYVKIKELILSLPNGTMEKNT